MKRPSRIRPPTLGERLGRLLPAAVVPGGLAMEATNQALDELPIPSRPTPGSDPRSVAVPPEGTPMTPSPIRPIRTPEQSAYDSRPRQRPLMERASRGLSDAAIMVGAGILPGAATVLSRPGPNNTGPTPESAPQSYSLPTSPSAPTPPPPLPIVNPEIIELVRAVNRGEISLEQAEEFAREANRSETLDKSGVSALLQASRDRARGT